MLYDYTLMEKKIKNNKNNNNKGSFGWFLAWLRIVLIGLLF